MDQMLADLQFPSYERLMRAAPPSYRLMIACGDVLLRFSQHLPIYPTADILLVGLPASPEEAQHHGVMACEPGNTAHMACFVQKPSPARMRELSARYSCFLDSGIWLLSERAVSVLMDKCGWIGSRQTFDGGMASAYDLYAQAGPALGSSPTTSDPAWGSLSAAVLPLLDGRFYHFGTSRSLLTSVHQLQHPDEDRRSFGHGSSSATPPAIMLHSKALSEAASDTPPLTWIENSVVPSSWSLHERHILTGVPENNWTISLPPGVCLDFIPTADGRLCVRAYGFDDSFRGLMKADTTLWMEQAANVWFNQRGFRMEDAGVSPNSDIFDAPIFPVLKAGDISGEWIDWLVSRHPAAQDRTRQSWLRADRLSARQLLSQSDIGRIVVSRNSFLRAQVNAEGLPFTEWSSRVDLEAAAEFCTLHECRLPSRKDETHGLANVHECMFHSALANEQSLGIARHRRHEQESFQRLRDMLLKEVQLKPVLPVRNVLDDQIVWCRSPVRLDLAGGWTDTPPYCLEHGGRVVNVATDINGQPPIQVFARWIEEPVIILRSIDLGMEERISTLDALRQWDRLGSGFGISKAAVALCGLDPLFSSTSGETDLAKHLQRTLGGGIALSMLAAVPKGSGLGTSSILAATVLGTLSELLGLHWALPEKVLRTLVLEQMLTSGGGWQDQVGGITRGLKIIETQPGIVQNAVLRWLPGTFFSEGYANRVTLLYYTGLTRVAHDILGEVVRGFFLNRAGQAGVVQDIGSNASFAADAIQRQDWESLAEAVHRSWVLNQLLDSGTNPPEVQRIVARISDHAAALKLLGAGGGGYLLIMAKDEDAGRRIRHNLSSNPPNPRARWVDMSLSETGFQATRS